MMWGGAVSVMTVLWARQAGFSSLQGRYIFFATASILLSNWYQGLLP